MTSPDREEIRKYLMLDETWLYSLIPPYLPEYERTQFLYRGQIEAGKRKFNEIREQLHQRLCKDWDLCNKLDGKMFSDTVELVVVVGNAIATSISGIPPILIATILVKIGLRKFCHCKEK